MALLAGFLFRSDPVNVTLLIGLHVHIMLATVFPGNLRYNFFQ